MEKISELMDRKPSRRNFLAGAGALGAAALVTGCSSSNSPAPNPSPTPAPAVTDADILTFALNLEYLETEFYLRAATGTGLSTANGAGTVTGGTRVPFKSSVIAAYAAEIASNELNHVLFLRSALTAAGATPITAPAIDFTNAFTAAAIAAGVISAGQTFNPFADDTSFLLGAFIFEDVGVTAYTGAARFLADKTYLDKAAGIQAVEAYHAAEIRTILARTGGSTVIDPVSKLTALGAANKISGLRGTLGGGAEVAISAGDLTHAATIAAADGSGLAFGRSFDQVLHIVYATANGAGVSSGGFFPSGLNGNIKTTFS